MNIDLRLGRWQDVMADVRAADVMITDAPYAARTHEGQRSVAAKGDEDRARAGIDYGAITRDIAFDFVDVWATRVRFFVVIFGDDLSSRWWREAWAAAGWYVFAPVGWVKECAAPRIQGDGPTCSVETITVARPKKRLPSSRRGSRPGHYLVGRGDPGLVGSKNLDGTRAVVRDYSLPGDLVVDPFAGRGTTPLACGIEGRLCVASEVDPHTFAGARRRLAKGYTPAFFAPPAAPATQLDVFGEAA